MGVSRRWLLTTVPLAVTARPLAGRAQPRPRRLGFLIDGASDPEGYRRCDTIVARLAELGWLEGETVSFDPRWTLGDSALTARFTSDLLLVGVDVILAHGAPAVAEVRRQTQVIPVVFAAVFDPVSAGFVRNLERPGGTCTGFMDFDASTARRSLELVRELCPQVEHVALLWNPTTAPYTARFVAESLEPAARAMGIALAPIPVPGAGDLEALVSKLSSRRGTALMAMPDPFLNNHRKRLVDLVARYRMPGVYPSVHFVNDGGLVSYGVDHVDVWRRAARYIDRIFRGENAGDLPVLAPTKFAVGVNIAVARKIGITVPATLLAVADRVID
jgi:putative ABC transport system substrate-binding protein